MKDMNMYPEPIGDRGIQLGNRLIPALNVQIWDDAPVVVNEHEIYGNYFEIPFEDGDHWVVDQLCTGGPVDITWYEDWHRVEAKEVTMDEAEAGMVIYKDWEEFLEAYLDKAKNGTRF